MSFECGQQRVMRLGRERPGSLALRRVLTNRMREYFTYGSVGGAGGNPGSYPAANAGKRTEFAGKSRLSSVIGPAWLTSDVRRRADVAGDPELPRNFLTANLH